MTPDRTARRGRDRPGRGDEGVTLIELVVSMTIMAIFLSMFTVGMLQLSRSARLTEAVFTAQTQMNIAYARLDKAIRYASGISTPGLVGTAFRVEYLTTNTNLPQCTQLELNVATRMLRWRSWPSGALPATQRLVPLVSNVEQVITPPGTAVVPFTVSVPSASVRYQRLTLKVRAVVGIGGKASSKQTEITFTALNTLRDVDNTAVCSEGRLAT